MGLTIVALVLFLALVLLVSWYAMRWFWMRKAGGVSVALRWQPDSRSADWHLGVGRYQGESFTWYRVWSLRPGPDRVFDRTALEIADRRHAAVTEAYAVPAGSTVLRVESPTQEAIEIAMAPGALTGFLSWLESAPPGRSVPWAS